MNYSRIYSSIIERAKSRATPDCYTELHHIKPRSMGGNDDKDNLVRLTAREHFIAHWLLAKIHNNTQMIYALFSMTKTGNSSQKRYTSHSFKYARESMAKFLSENRSGENHPLYGVRGEASKSFGTKRTPEQKDRISKAMTGKMSGSKNHASIAIKNIDTGEVFESIRQAQMASSGNVSYAVRFGGTAGGHRYSYLDENGVEVKADSKLKGYASGSNHGNAKSVINTTTGQRFDTIKEAAESINKTGSAVSWAIKNNKEICGFIFKVDEQ